MLESALGSYSSDILSKVGISLKVLIGILLLGCLLLLMSGLMVVLFVMRFLVLLVLVLVFMLDCMLITGGTGVGGILMILVLLLSSSCLGLSSLLGPLQTVQRAEFWGVVLALQATNAVHLGVDNLNVVRHVGRLLNGLSSVRPLELVDDGDLIILIRKLLSIRGEGTMCISRSRVMLMRVWSLVAKCGFWIVMVILVLMRLLTLVVVGFGLMLLMLGGIFLVYVGCGILLFWFCIGSLLPFSCCLG